MRFEFGHYRELKALLEAEKAAHQSDVENLRERLDYQRTRATRLNQVVQKQTDSICTLGGKINHTRQLCDAAEKFGTHVSIERVREALGDG